MSFDLYTDSGSNLTADLLARKNILIIPFVYTVEGREVVCAESVDGFDSHGYYDSLRAGVEVKTALLNMQNFMDAFRPSLENGRDVVYVGLSSGISGTYHNACLAAQELMEEFPGRTVRAVDSKGAGLGTGILTCTGADFREAGMNANEAADALEEARERLCEYFTVADLMFLRRTGRVSGATAVVGSLLNIKPLLRGDEEGHIVAYEKCRGRKKAVEAIVKKFRDKNRQSKYVAISHGDCLAEAELLKEQVLALWQPEEMILCPHEPLTGAHVGPGMLALFFFGDCR